MPTEAWEKLVSWYGLAEGQQPIPRKVVEHGMYLKQCKVEVYLIDLELCQNSDLENVISRPFSKGDTIGIKYNKVVFFICYFLQISS